MSENCLVVWGPPPPHSTHSSCVMSSTPSSRDCSRNRVVGRLRMECICQRESVVSLAGGRPGLPPGLHMPGTRSCCGGENPKAEARLGPGASLLWNTVARGGCKQALFMGTHGCPLSRFPVAPMCSQVSLTWGRGCARSHAHCSLPGSPPNLMLSQCDTLSRVEPTSWLM